MLRRHVKVRCPKVFGTRFVEEPDGHIRTFPAREPLPSGCTLCRFNIQSSFPPRRRREEGRLGLLGRQQRECIQGKRAPVQMHTLHHICVHNCEPRNLTEYIVLFLHTHPPERGGFDHCNDHEQCASEMIKNTGTISRTGAFSLLLA